jgi:phosphate-selective porin OprO and OprP
MVGYAGWTMERATIGDATIPILADGVKWLGYAPKAHLIWNLGFYVDWLSVLASSLRSREIPENST